MKTTIHVKLVNMFLVPVIFLDFDQISFGFCICIDAKENETPWRAIRGYPKTLEGEEDAWRLLF